jgi:beta-phosphoglucomutase
MTRSNFDKGVIFDLDGVLIDTGEAHKQSWFDLAALHGWTLTAEQFYQTFGMQNAQIIPFLTGKKLSPDEIQKLSDWKEQRYREIIAGKLTLLDGAESLIKKLRAAGFRIAIGTSTPLVNLEFMFHETGSQRLFDTWATSEDVARSKPSPDTFLKAAEKLGLPPSCCVVVEDSIPGVEAAHNAAMPVVGVTNTRTRDELLVAQADLVTSSLADLSVLDFENLLMDEIRKSETPGIVMPSGERHNESR